MNIFGIEPKVWFPVITLIVGAALKELGDWVTHRRTATREIASRRIERQAAAHLRRIEFERGTLLELQDTCQQLARHTGRLHFEDGIAYKRTGEWGKSLVSDETSDGARVCQASLSKLRSRTQSEAIRQLADQFSSECATVALASAKAASDSAINKMSVSLNELNDRIGSELRALDSDENDI
ncbi:hypothetical protein [Burkholderia ubonensis]|uniref:hypothetical protein n=1 Tax=Burkholderia ubonensis TaxID=101571 RepID=UPI000F55BC2F|nr:hypothetical protein [Burkholderia ubonensis]